MPFKSRVLLSYSFLGILEMKPTDIQSQLFWGLISPMQVPRVGVPNVACSSEISSVFVRSLSLVDHSTRHGFGESVSQCVLFVFCCEGGVQLVFTSFVEKNCSMCSYRFGLSMGEGELWVFLCHHLE